MEQEINIPGGDEKVSVIPFPETIAIARTFLRETDRKKILDVLKKEYDLSQMADNLVSTERTGWEIHNDEVFKEYYDNIVYKYIFEAMLQIASYPKERFEGLEFNTKIDTLDCWFARCKKGGYTDPHDHASRGICFYSYACYLELPSGLSSLTFANQAFNFKKRIMVREGDILVFPSNLRHWSFDTEENRSLLSGNFIWSVKKEWDNQNNHMINDDKDEETNEENEILDFIKSNINVSRLAQSTEDENT